MARLQTADVTCAGDEVALAADIVHRNCDVFGDLSLHAEVVEQKLRSPTRKIVIRKGDTCPSSCESARSSIARSKRLTGTYIIASPECLAGGTDRRDRRQNIAGTTEVRVRRRECRIVVEIEGRSRRRARCRSREGGGAVESSLACSSTCSACTTSTASVRIKNAPAAAEDGLLVDGISEA